MTSSPRSRRRRTRSRAARSSFRPTPRRSSNSRGAGHHRLPTGKTGARATRYRVARASVRPDVRRDRDHGRRATVTSAIGRRGIGKRFPGVIANHDIDITIRTATIHALVGENGAGKSTLMKILYGVQKPDDGTITVNGSAVSFAPPGDAIAQGIGMVFQHFMLADNLTVLENVTLGAEKLHGIGDAAREEIVAISQRYGFDLDPDELVETLGVGER